MNCNICKKNKAKRSDYRFIDSCGIQGKVFSCLFCYGLSDEGIRLVVKDDLNPKELYRIKGE